MLEFVHIFETQIRVLISLIFSAMSWLRRISKETLSETFCLYGIHIITYIGVVTLRRGMDWMNWIITTQSWRSALLYFYRLET
jgi:hypothetical protein